MSTLVNGNCDSLKNIEPRMGPDLWAKICKTNVDVSTTLRKCSGY